MKYTEVDLIACLGETALTMQELNMLSRDDVLVLDTKIEDFLKVNVGEQTRFLCSIGELGKKLAVRIEEISEIEGMPSIEVKQPASALKT